MKKPFWFITSLFICFFTAFLGSSVTTPSIDSWFQSINKPIFNPPNWIFAPVWTLLFFLMAVSFYLILIKKTISKKAVALFMTQLILNFLWSYAFFFLHSPLLALIDIILLVALVILTYKQFKKIDKLASQLLLPYLAWISFATILNLAILLLN